MSNRLPLPLTVGVFLVTAWIAYAGLIDQPWSYDDEPHVAKAATVLESPGILLDGASKEPLRFVSHLYFLAIYVLTDASPGTYHFTNILLHLVNCGILIHVIRRWVGLDIAVISGFLFLINTAGYEAIYSIAASAALLGTAFALLALDRSAAYLTSRQGYGWLTAAGCYLACLLSYESYISVLIPLAALAFARGRFSPESKRLLMALCGALVVVGLIDALAFQTSGEKVAFNQMSVGLHVPGNFGFFFGRLVLCPFFTPGKWGNVFPYDIHSDDWALYSGVGWLIFGGCVWWSIRDEHARAATLWCTATVLPYLFSSDHMYFTRYWYLPAAGDSVLYALAIHKIADRTAAYRMAVSAALVLVLGLFGIQKAWTFEGRYLFHAANYYLAHKEAPEQAETFYSRTIREYGYDTGLAHSQRGVALTRMDRKAEAIVSFRRATELDESLGVAYYNLGALLWSTDAIEEAVMSFERAIALNAGHVSILSDIGSRLVAREEWELAIRVWGEAARYWPDKSEPHAYLGVSLFNAGRHPEARAELEKALELDEKNNIALYGLGLTNELSGDTRQAIRFYQQALAIAPNDTIIRSRLDNLTQTSP